MLPYGERGTLHCVRHRVVSRSGPHCGPARSVRDYADLPEAARRYVARLEEVSGVPAAIISTGSERDHTILRSDVIAACQLPIGALLEK